MDLRKKFDEAAAAHAGLDLVPGQRVIDAKTTEVATVMSGALVVANADEMRRLLKGGTMLQFAGPGLFQTQRYVVKFGDGKLESRDRSDLVTLPAELRADLEDFHP